MALRNEYSWDVALLPIIGAETAPGLGMGVTEDSGGTPANAQIAFTTGVYTHTDISSVDSAFSAFGAALKAALDADATLTGTYTVTWNGTTGYTIVNDLATTLDLGFTTATTTEHGTNLRRLLGFSANQTGATGTTGYSSNVRPYYLVIPAIQGRSSYSREKESPDIVNEAIADDGSRVFIAKATADKVGSWVHPAEIETTPAVFSAAGTPTHKAMVDAGTAANDVPWSWEHSFEHLRTHHHRVLVIDGSDSEVWEVRADGMWFDPSRWAGTDQPLWAIPFKGRKIGAL